MQPLFATLALAAPFLCLQDCCCKIAETVLTPDLAALTDGSDMGEEEAEEQRLTLITRLLSNSAVIDYDGAVQVIAVFLPISYLVDVKGGRKKGPHKGTPCREPVRRQLCMHCCSVHFPCCISDI